MAAKAKNKKEEKESGSKEKGKRVKFLPIGKYFLILLVLVAQIFAAYKIVDKNYGKVYSYFESITAEETVTHKLEELIVNPAESNGQRFLVVEVSLELASESHIELIEKNSQKIKHNMIEALSARNVRQLNNFEEREILREELAEIINEAIGLRSVRNLYYTRYVMQ